MAVGRRLLKRRRTQDGAREDKFASIWQRSECRTRVIVSAHFICILINSIVARPSLWHLSYHPRRIFLVFPSAASADRPVAFLRRSFLPLCATIRPAICGLHLFLRPRLLRHSDLWLVLLTAARGMVFMPTSLVAGWDEDHGSRPRRSPRSRSSVRRSYLHPPPSSPHDPDAPRNFYSDNIAPITRHRVFRYNSCG